MRYVTVCEQSQSNLEAVVNKYLEDGGQVQGGVSMCVVPFPSSYSPIKNVTLLMQGMTVPVRPAWRK